MTYADDSRDAPWRRLLDPTRSFGSDGPRAVERRTIEVLGVLDGRAPASDLGDLDAFAALRAFAPHLARTRDLVQFDYAYAADGDDLDFISFVISPDHLEIRLPSIEWTLGYAGPAIATNFWRRQPFKRRGSRALANFIAAGIGAQRARFIVCVHCGERTGPGHQIGLEGQAPMCHGCASAHHGVVY